MSKLKTVMTPARWALLSTLFDRALAVEESKREDFVRAACAGDATLEHSLIALLHHHEAADFVLEAPTLTMERTVEIVSSGLRTFLPGELVAERFRIVRFIAEGGMGGVTVNLPEKPPCDYAYVLKVNPLPTLI